MHRSINKKRDRVSTPLQRTLRLKLSKISGTGKGDLDDWESYDDPEEREFHRIRVMRDNTRNPGRIEYEKGIRIFLESLGKVDISKIENYKQHLIDVAEYFQKNDDSRYIIHSYYGNRGNQSGIYIIDNYGDDIFNRSSPKYQNQYGNQYHLIDQCKSIPYLLFQKMKKIMKKTKV